METTVATIDLPGSFVAAAKVKGFSLHDAG